MIFEEGNYDKLESFEVGQTVFKTSQLLRQILPHMPKLNRLNIPLNLSNLTDAEAYVIANLLLNCKQRRLQINLNLIEINKFE